MSGESVSQITQNQPLFAFQRHLTVAGLLRQCLTMTSKAALADALRPPIIFSSFIEPHGVVMTSPATVPARSDQRMRTRLPRCTDLTRPACDCCSGAVRQVALGGSRRGFGRNELNCGAVDVSRPPIGALLAEPAIVLLLSLATLSELLIMTSLVNACVSSEFTIVTSPARVMSTGECRFLLKQRQLRQDLKIRNTLL